MINALISWTMRLDHWTRKPLLFAVFPLSILMVAWETRAARRALTFQFWDFHYRLWWVAWDGTLIGAKNRTLWWWQ